MGYPLQFAVRYLGSKKRASISAGTAFAVLGVALGVAALATIMSVTGGFHQQFRGKVLGVNAHVLVLKYSSNFREYRNVMKTVATQSGVVGVAPFSINPMMLAHGKATATGVLVKGVDPRLSLGVKSKKGDEWGGEYQTMEPVLDLPRYIVRDASGACRSAVALEENPDLKGRPCSLQGLRRPSAKPGRGKYPIATDEPTPEPTAAASASSGVQDPPQPPKPVVPTPRQPTPPQGSVPAAPATADPAILAAPAATSAYQEPQRRAPYSSKLPDDDDIPFDVDPCEDPKAVAGLPGMVVGVSLAKSLGLKVGSCLTVTSPTIGYSFARGEIKPPVAKQFRVIAMFEAGFDQYDSKLVYTDLYEAQTFYDHGDTVTGIEMKVSDINEAGSISDAIATKLASGIYHTMDWKELNHGLFTALTIQQWGMSAVLALIIVVAAFTVVATLIMVVLDKQKEISVLKAMGATNSAILRIFLYQGALIGFAGTSLGLLLGLLVCKGLLAYGFPLDPKVYFISRLPVLVRPQEFLVTGGVAIVICLVATIVPSLYAARLRPADGFRSQ